MSSSSSRGWEGTSCVEEGDLILMIHFIILILQDINWDGLVEQVFIEELGNMAESIGPGVEGGAKR